MLVLALELLCALLVLKAHFFQYQGRLKYEKFSMRAVKHKMSLSNFVV
jgi:hypothetical protein